MRKEVIKINIISEVKVNGILIPQSNIEVKKISIDEIILPNKCIFKNFFTWLCNLL